MQVWPQEMHQKGRLLGVYRTIFGSSPLGQQRYEMAKFEFKIPQVGRATATVAFSSRTLCFIKILFNFQTGVENGCQDENAFAKPAKIFGGQENKPFSIFVEEQPTRQALKPVTRSNVTKSSSTLCDITSLVRPALGPISTAKEDEAIHLDDGFGKFNTTPPLPWAKVYAIYIVFHILNFIEE